MKKTEKIFIPLWQGGSHAGIHEMMNHFSLDKNDIHIKIENETEPTIDNINNKNIILKYCNQLYTEVDNVLKRNNFPLTIGGDHTIALASVSAAKKHYDELAVIWVDAHGDFNTPTTSPSKNPHGMIFAALIGEGDSEFVNLGHDGVKIKKENIVLFATRELDEGEINLIEKNNIKVISDSYIKEYGLKNALKEISKYLENKTNNLHISYDLDVIDPKIIPGVSVPVEGGLNIDEVNSTIDYLFNNFNITSMDVVEYNPLFDKDNITLNLLKDTITNIDKKIKAI